MQQTDHNATFVGKERRQLGKHRGRRESKKSQGEGKQQGCAPGLSFLGL